MFTCLDFCSILAGFLISYLDSGWIASMMPRFVCMGACFDNASIPGFDWSLCPRSLGMACRYADTSLECARHNDGNTLDRDARPPRTQRCSRGSGNALQQDLTMRRLRCRLDDALPSTQVSGMRAHKMEPDSVSMPSLLDDHTRSTPLEHKT